MKVLVITGDRTFKKGHVRFDVQAKHVERLETLFWGRKSFFPKIPEGDFDVVSTQDPFWRGVFAWHVARKKKARFNVQIHTDLSVQSFLRKRLARLILRRAHSIRVVSEKIKDQVEMMRVRAPIHILPVFVDLQKFRNITSQAHTTPTILWVGRFEKEKNPLAAISIWENVCKGGIEAQLIMLGEGSLRKKVAQKANNRSSVQILGWQDPATHLGVASVLLSTSLHESWGASMVEALAAGVPVVAPDVGIAKEAGAIIAPREKLTDAVTEVLKKNPQAKLQLKLIEDPDEWGRKWVETL